MTDKILLKIFKDIFDNALNYDVSTVKKDGLLIKFKNGEKYFLNITKRS